MRTHQTFRSILLLVAGVSLLHVADRAVAEGAAQLQSDARGALASLEAGTPAAKELSKKAVAILVFPKITKAGFIVGGQYGEGVLFERDKAVGYYSTGGASYGLQAGAQEYGYAMFFMKEAALQSLKQTDGFEVGVGPSVVVVDEGMGKSLTTITAQEDVYAFIFGQQGLMAGVGIQGNKITQISK